MSDLSELLRAAPIHPPETRLGTFRNPAGVSRTIAVLAACAAGSRSASNPSRIQREVWAEFKDSPDRLAAEAQRIREALALLQSDPLEEPDEGDSSYSENGVTMRLHRSRERARGLRPKLLAKVRRQHGTIRCEACGRKERTMLGAAAESEFEAHHRDPLSTSDGIRQSRLADFALVCASCHRLIHAVMRHEARTVSVGEFSARLERPLPSNG